MHPFQNPDLSVGERVADLLGRLTLEEKVSQMAYMARAIPRLGIPEYNWWNEALHGVGRAGIATVFPQAIGLAATFDDALLHRAAVAISDEARAKHHEFARQGYRRQYQGLTFWSPNVNIFRDPRWGRGQETYGEDPYLTGRMGVAFVKGMQGDDPAHLKLVATPKHYAVHSGPESLRHSFDARVGAQDLHETYLPAFRDCVTEGGASSVMGAYNRTNGELCCASPTLLTKILREAWGFTGHVVSDCGAIADFHEHHAVTSSPEESAAAAVRGGCDLECGCVYYALPKAVQQGLVTEAEIDRALGRLLDARVRLGMFDPPARDRYAAIPYDVVDCDAHRALARESARASIVLLKNKDRILPLRRDLPCIAVIGPNANDREMLLGNYNGFPSRSLSVLEGIQRAVSPATRVLYARGSDVLREEGSGWGDTADDGFAEALAAAERADVVVMALGLNNHVEGEEGSAAGSDWSGDRKRIDLPVIQQRLFTAVASKGKPIVLVLLSGSAVSVPAEDAASAAVLQAWYPGEEGGAAIADILFGDYSPSGRLPVSVVASVDQLPPFTEYAMEGRTYRFMRGEPLYPFGFGLSYAEFRYGALSLERAALTAGEDLRLTVSVTNTGSRDAHEVAQLYVKDLEASVRVPSWRLAGFARVALAAGETRRIPFTLRARQMAVVDGRGRHVVEPGRFRLSVGGRQPDERSRLLAGTETLHAEFEATGGPRELPV
jgi:beta-glucosidase